jgi:solute carrier family 25 protein 16
MRTIYHSDGTRGLFRGHSATLLRIFPYAGIKFLAYEQVRAVLIKKKSQETPGRRFLAGATAGLMSVFFTYPLEVIRVRLAFETKGYKSASLSSICKQIYREHPPKPHFTSTTMNALPNTVAAAASTIQAATPSSGLANFYRGFTPTMWGMLPYAGASFLTHDSVGDLLRHPGIARHTTLPNTATTRKPAQLNWWAQNLAGGLAGFVSQTLSYPIEVIRRRMQVSGVVGDGRKLSMASVASSILKEKGWRGFFVGLGIGYVKVIPMTATSFFVYERMKFWMGI